MKTFASSDDLPEQAAELYERITGEAPLPPLSPSIPASPPKPARVYGPIDIHITMDTEVGDPELDPETGQCIGPGATVRDLVVEQAVTRMVPQLLPAVADALIAAAQVEIAERVAELVREVLTEPFQITDQWGHKRGEPVTIRQRVAEEIKAQLQPAGRGDFGRNTSSTVLTDVIKAEVDGALGAEMRAEVAKGKALIIDALKTNVAEVLSKAVAAGLR